jgi:hypothetical protein
MQQPTDEEKLQNIQYNDLRHLFHLSIRQARC